MAAKKTKSPKEGSLTDSPVKAAKIVKKKTAKGGIQKSDSLIDVIVTKGRFRASRPSLFLFTLYFLYKNLYILGITIIRRALHFRRSGKRFVLKLKGSFYALLHRARLFAGRIYRNILVWANTPVRRIRDTYQQQRPAIAAARLEGKTPVLEYLPVIETAGRFVLKIIATIFNHVAPVIAAVFLINMVGEWLNQPIALKLIYEGQELGYIQNEAVFDEATQIVRERTILQDELILSIGSPTFIIEEVDVDEPLNSTDIADMILRISGEDIETAYGLYVNGVFLGAVTDKDAILNELTKIKQDNLLGKPDERVEFVQKIRFDRELHLANSVIDPELVINQLYQNEQGEETYTVQDGDTPSEIADKNGMRYAELLRLNPDIEEGLWPGDVLKTKVARPFLSVKNTFVDTYEEEVPFDTVTVENATYAKNYSNTLQEGEDGVKRVIAEVTMVNGQETERYVLDDSEILVHPISERIVVGINDPVVTPAPTTPTRPSTDMSPSTSQPGATGFIWPTVSGIATTYRNHDGNGVDIAPGGAGHPIFAAKGGVITKVVNGYTGYGHYVIIDHEDGFSTLYAHNSEIYVAQGQRVSQGDTIAAMGRTGRATGNHLHFEVRYNGSYMNPTDYIGYSK